jgi:two-component system chemotaxis response regulator CheB
VAVRALVVQDLRGDGALVKMLGAAGDIETGQPWGFSDALDAIRKRHPDIVVMVPNSEAQAIAAIESVMAREPVPILVIGSGSWSSDAMLRAGAVEVLPDGASAQDEGRLADRVRVISRVNVIRHIRGRSGSSRRHLTVPVVGIAASTGGPQALAVLLGGLGGLGAPVLVVQHLHPDFTANFRDWMDRVTSLNVQIATEGVTLEVDHVYVAPPDVHMKVTSGRTIVLDPEPRTLHRPSADILFGSIADHIGPAAVGVLLTGMGEDGAAGLLRMRAAGARTIAQDEVSSAVYGMPREAKRLGAAEEVLPLASIADAVIHAVGARAMT